MPLETKLLLLCLGVLAFGFVLSVTRVLGAWAEHHISRHDLIVESKQRRYDYLKAIYDRDQELMALEAEGEAENETVIIEEPDEAPAEETRLAA